ncbi:MAG: FadR/GntR family transcriptional regulator [Victivallaceae bacterium]
MTTEEYDMFIPVQNKRIYQHVVEQIQEMILDGRLKSGDRMPSERTMAEQFAVSRNSVREAIRTLEILGIVESRQGGGNFIATGSSDFLCEPLSIMFKLNSGKFTDLLELRRSLEIEAASLAAQRITRPEAEKMSRMIDELKKTDNEARCIELDKQFHLLIAEISGNSLLSGFLHAISRIVEQAVRDGRKYILTSLSNNQTLLRLHQDLCDAIVSKNVEAAVIAVRRHFDFILDNLRK